MRSKTNAVFIILASFSFGQLAYASVESTGPNGINSFGLGLTGNGVGIGQVEKVRPGDPKNDSLPGPPDFDTTVARYNDDIDPERVFFTTVDASTGVASYTATANSVTETESEHATLVAGVMIATDTAEVGTIGVAPQADLFSTGYNGSPSQNLMDIATVAVQHIATRNDGDIRAINMSFGGPLLSNTLPDGTSTLSSFVDWSAKVHDVLYVTVGPYTPDLPDIRIPVDNFNGITVAMSKKNTDGVYRDVDPTNVVIPSPIHSLNNRTYIDLIAPGDNVLVATQGNSVSLEDGTSIAAPHVTGTVALLQEYANTQVGNSVPGWTSTFDSKPTARRHEVMKAVLMNSADKIKDDGTFAMQGYLLGMDRTVLKKLKPHQTTGQEDNWFDSNAFSDEFYVLDEEMGAGHLNAKRALKQFSSGEFEADGADVPVIGWDYGATSGLGDINKYVLDSALPQGSFISITLAWDREVTFSNEGATAGVFESGDEFNGYSEENADDVINDLDLHLMPKGATIFDLPIWSSPQDFMPLEHIFINIPETGEYEIWVEQFDNDLGGGQDYAIAWWAYEAPNAVSMGDFDGSGFVDAADYTAWKDDFGMAVTPGTGADGNGNGVIDAADYTVWLDNLGATISSSAVVSETVALVPEPSTTGLLFAMLGSLLAMRRGRQPA